MGKPKSADIADLVWARIRALGVERLPAQQVNDLIDQVLSESGLPTKGYRRRVTSSLTDFCPLWRFKDSWFVMPRSGSGSPDHGVLGIFWTLHLFGSQNFAELKELFVECSVGRGLEDRFMQSLERLIHSGWVLQEPVGMYRLTKMAVLFIAADITSPLDEVALRNFLREAKASHWQAYRSLNEWTLFLGLGSMRATIDDREPERLLRDKIIQELKVAEEGPIEREVDLIGGKHAVKSTPLGMLAVGEIVLALLKAGDWGVRHTDLTQPHGYLRAGVFMAPIEWIDGVIQFLVDQDLMFRMINRSTSESWYFLRGVVPHASLRDTLSSVEEWNQFHHNA